MKKAKGTIFSGREADGSVRRSHDGTVETLSDHGIRKSQSFRWQKLAVFEARGYSIPRP
jgi:hypothetical protein